MGRWLWIVAFIVIIGIGAGVFLLRPVEGPARDLTLTADAGHGRYVMLLGGCNACHTDTGHGGQVLAGGAPIVTPFGSFVPPNITPDPTAGIGSWTLADFSAAMSEGHGPHDRPLYPAFPYEQYTLMSDQDLVDLWAALREVPPVATKAPDHSLNFPFNQRIGMLAWQQLFFKPARFQPTPGKSEAWNRGKYLVTGPGHCVACHTPRNALGVSEIDHALAGSPRGSIAGRVADITKASLEKAGYDQATLADVLNGGLTPGSDTLVGRMAEVVKESTSQWTQSDRDAVATYLLDAN